MKATMSGHRTRFSLEEREGLEVVVGGMGWEGDVSWGVRGSKSTSGGGSKALPRQVIAGLVSGWTSL